MDLDLDDEEGGFMEAEGGGLNLDEEKRQKAAERIEVCVSRAMNLWWGTDMLFQPMMVYQGKHGFK